MLKNRGKILLTLMLMLVVGVLFATASFALKGENITIQFYNSSGNAIDTGINTSQIVQGEAQILGGNTVRLPTKDVAEGSSFNWRTDDGRCWEGGSIVTFYDSARLFPVTAIDVTTAEEIHEHMPNGKTVRLLNDIYLETKPGFPWPGTCTVILNGKTLELNSSLGTAWGGQRAGTFFYGTGTVKYAGNGTFMNMNGHGWGGDSCRLFVGAGVTIDAPNANLAYDGDGSYVQGYPWLQIFGIVNCKTVLTLANGGNRNPRIEVYDGAQLNVSGALIVHNAAGNTVRVNISGGNINYSGSVNFFQDSNAVFTLTGGSYTFNKEADYATLQQNIDISLYRITELTGSDGKTYKTVIGIAPCIHDYKLHSTIEADCSTCAKDYFYCEACETFIRIAYGTKGEHNFAESPTSHKDPTKTTPGWDKYVCPDCSSIKLEYIYYDPTNDPVIVIVKTETGTKEVEAPLKDIFVVDTSFTVTGIKAFGDYTLEDIVGVTIPVGIAKVNISTVNSNVKTVIFGQGLVAEVTSLKGFNKLEQIIIKDVADLVFKKDCATKTVTSIKSDVPGAHVEYEELAFYQHTNLTEMTFSKSSIYNFGKQSFKESGVKSLTFVDGCTVTFSGEQAFYASKLEYLYVGKGITTIANKPFDCAYYLQTVILMDVTSLSSDYTFCVMNKGTNPCVVYHHAASLSMPANTFYQSHGVILYTKATVTQGFNSCQSTTKNGVSYPAYTIHYGITHAYDRVEKDPTCLAEGSVKYITTCPCGKNEGTSHKVFSGVATNSSSYTIEDYTDKIKEKLPHDLASVGKIQYSNGYTKRGYVTRTCSMCKNGIEEENPSCLPLVSTYGYSVNEKGGASMTVKYVINEAVLKNYEQANGIKLEYGTIVAVKKSLGDNTPLDASGNARSGVIKTKTVGYSSNEIKLVNLQDSHKTVSYVMSVYVIDGNQITYIQDTETVENPSGVTYKEVNELAEYYASLSLAPVPAESKEQ